VQRFLLFAGLVTAKCRGLRDDGSLSFNSLYKAYKYSKSNNTNNNKFTLKLRAAFVVVRDASCGRVQGPTQLVFV